MMLARSQYTRLLALGAVFLVGACTDSSDESPSLSSAQGISSQALSSSGALVSSSAVLSSSSSNAGYAKIISDKPALKRVVAYLPLYRPATALDRPEASAYTHVMVAFANPDTALSFASFLKSTSWKEISSRQATLQARGVHIGLSIGGGSESETVKVLLKSDHRERYVAALVHLVDSLAVDGVDVDFEGASVQDTANYNPFVRLLGDSLSKRGKWMSAAVASWMGYSWTKEILDRFTFLNLMTYDATGPWNPKKVAHHSPYSMALSDLKYWSVTRGVAADKLVLGVPFYGHQFTTAEDGTKGGSSYSYAEILSQYPGSQDLDSVGTRNTPEGITFYNGRPTIQAKTLLAREYGGLMIWEIAQDEEGEYSLLKVVADHTGK